MQKIRSKVHNLFKDYLPLKSYFRESLGSLVLGLALLLTVDLAQLLIPLVIKKAIDGLTLQTATTRLLLQYALIIMAIAAGMAVLRFIWRHLLFGFARRLEQSLRNRLYDHIQSLSLSYYQRIKTGDLMAHFVNDINAIRMATGMGLVALTDGLVMGLMAIGFMIYISPLLTLITLIPTPFVIYFTARLTHRMAMGHEKVQKSFGALTEKVREAFAGIRIVKSYNRETWETQKIEQEGRNYITANLDLAKLLALFNPLLMILTNIGLVIAIWLGGRLTLFNRITTGDLVAFISYLNLLTWPMLAIGWVTSLLQRGAASMRRINRILDEVPEIKDRPGLSVSQQLAIKGQIRFHQVTYRYPGQAEPALDRISLTIPAQKTTAIVGRVGCGKTTLLQAIPRILEISDGTMLLDDLELASLPLQTLRRSIGFVTQDVFIFSDTIRNNILFGREDVSEEQLWQVLRIAQIDAEIRALEKGVDTLLGERGITLSGGQRQRLTIARALIADPAVLILDDALSMVDTQTEERILNQILSRRQGRTSLIVSHRLTTISRADWIVVLEKGRAEEVGNHRALLDREGLYAQLYQKQLLTQELETGVVES